MGRGRGRVELKRIQNRINRQVTFSKRRNGLLKKAWELSILCDVEVALIIFSPTAKIHEFASHGMHNTLCKYKYFSGTTSNYNQDTQNIEYWHIEIERLKAKMADLERKQKHMIGEDLGSLSSNQLQRLERQLSGGVNKIRLRKRQILSERIGFLKRKISGVYESQSSMGMNDNVQYQQDNNVLPQQSLSSGSPQTSLHLRITGNENNY